jgi:hypothetical protein
MTAHELRELLRRATCALLGHVVQLADRGAPVAEFSLCRRCGRWWR